jgi:DNA-binding response OmpR family regulator
MHALIIEPESLVAMMVEDVLKDSGFDSFAFATTALEALSAAHTQSPDLIVADIDLGEDCGVAAVESICCEKTIPVIFASDAFRDALTRIPTAIAVGKPFCVLALTTAIAEATLVHSPH